MIDAAPTTDRLIEIMGRAEQAEDRVQVVGIPPDELRRIVYELIERRSVAGRLEDQLRWLREQFPLGGR